MADEINHFEDVLDSRDIIARIEELQELLTPQDENDPIAESEDYEVEREELSALTDLARQCEGYGDWPKGEALIRNSYFAAYAEELAGDVCDMPTDQPWPFYCIDWEYAARELLHDYTAVDFNGVEYYMRAT